ncbi:MAG: DNA-directed RNA polymerase subunit beta' [Gammaproteobacteria bacterium]|jgi:DNA-directed RNA polymerase subunit beta'|nr:DNA-directed RNA polymerase subunit beta' [Gammaproteobacteria bacterium]MBT3490530.1 DNA-directed RNA polymerase subunit beta' [Gammaproteobacteria bacterium]MBT3894327.1 DNA-directed RNA polymerase subunit beta' [Gammaproteobacteria bacterium]MBT5687136.1 DNA-directed RNA polymerase subunit beta' [Gammaproteobacteria bacterium]MBT6479146.1 DNA-directed RNA polymerase subunit beta' [Gammaproteobacteria bacterium]
MKDLLNFLKAQQETEDFDAIRIGLAAPEKIRSWSFGEVKKPETINYRTFKPERDGLFCAKIFGPIKDYECLCGKYKRLKHRGVICEKCGVEVTLSKVRRERMGHIDLASPVAHIWYLRSLPSRLGMLLDISLKNIERVLYFESFIVIEPGLTDLERGQLLTDDTYLDAIEEWGDEFDARMGAEAIDQLIRGMDLQVISAQLHEELAATKSEAKTKKLSKRLKLIEGFLESGNKPEWMLLRVLPVLPPELRPLVPLEGGRFATSDLNDLYRRVINRNNRLKRLLDLAAPDIIVRNEKRMLQESVDALMDNGRRGRAVTGTNKRPLKSLADMIKGKQGRFRQNLLGKRVDYSGRSVIVVGPTLKLHQCGLPKAMALELFKPFIFGKLQLRGLATTIKAAKKMVEREEPVVWDILDDVIREHPVMLNRAPTLHRLGIQAFEPVLIEGKAIQLHPLVCTAFNADFDGDQMAVHVPLSIEAQLEARTLMLASNNVLHPANGEPIIVPTQDVVLGLYYMTRESINAKGEGMMFSGVNEVRRAYESKIVGIHAKVQVRINDSGVNDEGEIEYLTQRVSTTVGRALLSEVLPEGLPFAEINKTLTKKVVTSLVDVCYRTLGLKSTVVFADRLMYTGFENSTRAGVSFGADDMIIPEDKEKILIAAESEVKEIQNQYSTGLVTNGERYNKVVDIWTHANDQVAKAMMDKIGSEEVVDAEGNTVLQDSFNSVFMMADSGARGSAAQIRQLAGMRGLMAKPDGSIIETPITANFREGLNVLQYFISTHGARKGLADTALKTANSGYLTRRLVDVSQDLVVTERDCGTTGGVLMQTLIEGGDVIEPLRERVLGRVTAENVVKPGTDDLLIPVNTLIDEKIADYLEGSSVDQMRVRSIITCETRDGVCAQCYGRDLARGDLISQGEAVGVIAAQSIGEPGTQLTMRTFHIGGAASRAAADNSVDVNNTGTVHLHNVRSVVHADGHQVAVSRSGEIAVVDETGRERERYKIPYGAEIRVNESEHVDAGQTVVTWDPHTHPVVTEVGGTVRFNYFVDGVSFRKETDEVTGLSSVVVTDSKQRAVGEQTVIVTDGKGQQHEEVVGNRDLRPMVMLVDTQGNEIMIPGTSVPAQYFLPAGAIVTVEDGAEVGVGDVMARIPQEAGKTRDITGGLPRVADLFEARKPKEPAVMAEQTGTITFGKETKGKQRVVIIGENGEQTETLIPKFRHVTVFEGEHVEKGEVIVDGAPDPHDILRLKGIPELARYINNEVQDVYRLQGVGINDKHIECIVRQMLRRVVIIHPGDTKFLQGEQVERARMLDENDRVNGQGKMPCSYENVLLGITKASLATDSFVSAASFQETTRVLTEASVTGKSDDLRGLKENVIVGRLIPAGTGLAYHKQRRQRRGLFTNAELLKTVAGAEEAVVEEMAVEAVVETPAEK